MLEVFNCYYEKVLVKVEWDNLVFLLVKVDWFYFEDMLECLQCFIGSVIYEWVVLLGKCIVEMYIVLAFEIIEMDFEFECFFQYYQWFIYFQYCKLVNEKLIVLECCFFFLLEYIVIEVYCILEIKDEIMDCFSQIYVCKIEVIKICVYGDYYFGQVFFNGCDFFIIDFEGEFMYFISECCFKCMFFKDVVGMICLLYYVVYGQLVFN